MKMRKRLINISKVILVKSFYKKFKIFLFIFAFSGYIVFNPSINADLKIDNKTSRNKAKSKENLNKENIFWEPTFRKEKVPLLWERVSESEIENLKNKSNTNAPNLSSLNRSIVFNDNIIGPDISWLVPPGFKWNKRYIVDTSIRGHNRREKGENFFGWNKGDAVGQLHLQPIHFENSSFGLNLGIRSVYEGNAPGGTTAVGEGLSLGFRLDKNLSRSSGIATGAEQLLHFDGLTDTGRDIYLTISKGWWKHKNNDPYFPLYVATAGFGTGKMAEGNIKGLCSDLFGGSGTEVAHQRRLCWSPVFSLAKVYNQSFSTFFEYNSKWFLLGTSISPFEKIPLRGTFAVQLSDHIENYKLNNLENMKWVFKVSLGF